MPLFARVTTSGRFIPTVDGLRFVAILAVVLYHLNGFVAIKSQRFDKDALRHDALYRLFDSGNCGVQLFFAISGFILALPFAEHYLRGGKPVPLGKYFLRRVTRLEPPYLINLTAVLVLLLLQGRVPAEELGPHFLASACYLHNLIYGQMSTINGVAWSLEIEVQFYIIAPLLAFLIFRIGGANRRLWMLLIIGALVLFKAILAEHAGPRFRLSLPFYLDHFLAGFVLADMYVTAWASRPQRSHLWDVIGFAAWLAIPLTQMCALSYYLLPFLTIVAYIGAFRGSILGRVLEIRWLVTIGGMCYTIYLYHFFIISLIGRYSLPQVADSEFSVALIRQAFLIVPAVFLICAILYLFLEKTFMYRDWPMKLAESIIPRTVTSPRA